MTNKEKFRYYKIHENIAGQEFKIGDRYGIFEIDENEIQERIDMTGYYYINDDGEKATTDEEFWKMEEIKKKRFYEQDSNEGVKWDGAFVDLIFEYWDGHNWKKIWLDHAGMRSGEVEDVTDEIGTLERIAYEVIDGALSFCKKAYKDEKGNYYYMHFSYCNDTLDFYQPTDLETLQGIFEDLE
jgi:hypothetical protein